MKLLLRLSRPPCLAIHVLVLLACFACWVPSVEAQTNNPPTLPSLQFGAVQENADYQIIVLSGRTDINDPDASDSVHSYELGGTDEASFRVHYNTNDNEWVLYIRNNFLDYDRPADRKHTNPNPTYPDPANPDPADPRNNSPAGDNIYVFTMTVKSGTGNREMSATETWMVQVREASYDEPPGIPKDLKGSGSWETPNQLIVEWKEGAAPRRPVTRVRTSPPPITSHNIQYREVGSSEWETMNVETGTDTTAMITGLIAGTNYEVQVQAVNKDGTSSFSGASTAMTANNAAPRFTTGRTTFTVNENTPITTPVTALEATDEDVAPTDPDEADAVTEPLADTVTYTLGDTADKEAFEIDEDTNELRFKAVPDFENPADQAVKDMTGSGQDSPAGDNVYIVAVTATSGEGARLLAETQWLTITVADVKEPLVERFALVPPPSGIWTPGSEIRFEVTFDDDGVDIPANLARENRPFITFYLGEETAANRRRAYWQERRDGNSTIVTFAYEVQADDFATAITVDEELGITVPPGVQIRNGAGAAAATTPVRDEEDPGASEGQSRLDFPVSQPARQTGGGAQPAPSPVLTQDIFVGVPLLIPETVDEKFAASSVPRTPLIFNEFGNGADATNDWLELRNVTGAAVSLKDWELSVVQNGEKKDVSLIVFSDVSVPANGLLLITHSKPDDTRLAAGNDIASDGKNGGLAHLTLVNSGLSLPDDGKFLLILRNAKEKLGENEAFVDVAGGGGSDTDAFIRDGEGKYDTYVWPLQVLQAPGEDAAAALGSGKVWQRAKADIVGYHKDAWIEAAFTGLGYDRQVSKSAAFGGTPGYPNGAAKETATTPKGSVTISEIMVDSAGGTLPQWIELYNRSKTEVLNLNRWKLEIQNVDSEELIGRPIVTLTLGEKLLQPNQTLLIVAGEARASSSSHLPADRIYNLFELHQKNLRVKTPRDTFLSTEGLYLKLTDREGELVDEVGNTDGNRRTDDAPAWALPLSDVEGARSSLIRRYDKGVALDGKKRASWVFAANIRAIDGELYYGHAKDLGTPGWRAGGALPVELSRFSVARNDAGAVVLTWQTESEVDNAGFNLRRSERRDGGFTLVNAALIAGAGTTGERQTYTFMDTSAKPGVEYYYQLEEVSFVGKPQLLLMQLLRGPVSAANRQLRTFGEVKRRE